MTEFERMVYFLDRTWDARSYIVPCLIGPIGIGKTSAVRQHAKNVGAKRVVVIIASQILPSEVSGITMPDPETKSMEIYDHYRLSHLEDGDILFFDELLEADDSVRSACLTLIEDRMLMSGNKLPDIQIIAATNPTVQAVSIKEAQRNRFLFNRFVIDQKQVHDYILETTGMDVSGKVLEMLAETGSDYNILSPRSLTKMCRWLADTPINEVDGVVEIIKQIWGSKLGYLLEDTRKMLEWAPPETQIREKLRDICNGLSTKVVLDFEDDSFEEIMSVLQALPEWGVIEAALNTSVLEPPPIGEKDDRYAYR